MSLTDIIELLNKIKVSKDFPIDIELLRKGFIETIKELQSGKVPEENITEVARIVNELLSS
ncbi:hypothetical protein [Candidatus Borrarchaeum sp.]|uniref:hypothetical protein n=1 Tax=Candidatus Borrarchaeum sp. TaxID=2846742 RepID=UPI00257C1AC8|nr:hypothetical protein [Candidatus Borrarchaeum sp.]